MRLVLLEFKLIKAVMIVLVTSNNKEDPIKNEGARLVISYPSFFKILKGSQLPISFMLLLVVFVTCSKEEALLKMKAPEPSKHFSVYKSMGIFQGQLNPQSLV